MAKSDRLTKFNGKVSKWKMYNELLSVRETQDMSESGIRRNASFYVDYKGFYSGSDRLTYIYTIDKYPRVLELSHRDRIREVCSEGVKVNFITDFDFEPIKWSSNRIKSKLRIWKSIDEGHVRRGVYSAHEDLGEEESIEWRRSSVDYLTKACKKYGRNTFRVRTIMLVSGVRGEDFDDSIDSINRVMIEELGLRPKRVLYDILGFIGMFSPFSNVFNSNVLKKVSNILVPDEICARFSTYSQGSVGKYGIWIGNDMEGRPVYKPLKRESVAPENWLIAGETGSGKSLDIKTVFGQMLARPDCIGTVMDVEGDEYLSWVELVNEDEKVLYLNLDECEGRYIDPVEIAETGIAKLDKGMYTNSYNFTRGLLYVLADVPRETHEWIDAIIKTSISEFYESIGVSSKRRKSWKNSKGCTIFDVIKYIEKYEPSCEEEKNTLELCLKNIKVNIRFLQTPVSVDEVVKAKLVVCSFNMKGAQEKSIDPVLMNSMQLSAAYVSYIRSVFACAMGKYNAKIWDEFQRWGHFPDSDKTVGVAITGGRKLGDINMIGTNKLSELLAHDTLNILENITTYAIGAIDDYSTIKSFCELKSIQHLEGELVKIAKYSKKREGYIEGDEFEENVYTHAFLWCLDSVRYVISKISMPDYIVKSELFYTGVEEVNYDA